MFDIEMPFGVGRCGLTATCAFLSVSAFAASTRADLINETVGSTAVMLDTSTDLQWLDCSATLGLSPSTALSDFPGYSLATISQVNSLLESAGISATNLPTTADSSLSYDDASYAPGQALYSTIGFTYFYFGTWGLDNWEQESWGDYLDGAGTGWDDVFINATSAFAGPPSRDIQFNPVENGLATSSSQDYDMLVQSVPEPASLGIVLLSLAWLGMRPRPIHQPEFGAGK